MITVHHLNNSRSQRILWLLEELGVDYAIKTYQRDNETMLAPVELRDVHPLGKAPVVTDGDQSLAESGAIIEYLVDKYDSGRLKPAQESAERLQYTYWLHYAEGSFIPLMLISLIVSRIENAPVPFFVRPVVKGVAGKIRSGYLDSNVRRHLEYMNDHLSNQTWFCGSEFTAADIQMSYAVEAAAARASLEDNYPALQQFLDRIRAMPSYRLAIDKGGPYSLLTGR